MAVSKFVPLYAFIIYLRLGFDLLQYWGYVRLQMPPVEGKPKFTRKDVTIVIMSTGHDPRLAIVLQKWLNERPGEIILTTIEESRAKLETILQTFNSDLIVWQTVPTASSREQMIKGITQVKTGLFAITDDRTYPSPQLLDLISSAFSDPMLGGITVPRDVIAAPMKQVTLWETFGALNQIRRRILHATLAYYHAGQVLNLSGGFSGVRTSILQSEAYYYRLRTETWLGRYKITTGEDNTFTRFIVQNGWKTGFLNSDDAMVCGGVAADAKYLKQVKRWSRDTARSYLKDCHFAFTSGKRRAYLHAGLNIAANYASDAAVITELVFLSAYAIALLSNATPETRLVRYALEHFIISSAFTILEHLPYFTKLRHLAYIPGAIAYMYMHALIVLYSCLTLHKSKWDSRPEVDPQTDRCSSTSDKSK